MPSFVRTACASAVLAAFAAIASADVLFSNFAANDEYDTERGWTMSYGGPLGGDIYEQAAPFTVTGGDCYFDTAEVAVLHNWGPDIVYFNLHADDGGVPGEILDSTTASGVAPPFELRPPMVADFGGDFVLKDGQTYWLALRTEETDALLAWAFNIVDDFGLRAQQLNDGPWIPAYGEPGTDSERGVYRINATPVPAPAQGVITYSWTVGDTGNNDGIITPGEAAVLTLFASMDPQAVGFAGSIFDISGNAAWARGQILSYDNFLDALTDDGMLGADNAITNIEAFQLPPYFNPNFDASNPVKLYEIVWQPDYYLFWVEGATTNHLNHDVYTDQFGTSQSYDAVITGFAFGIPAPATLALLGLGAIVATRRR